MQDINTLIQEMTLEEKIGQLFLLAFSGNRLDEARVLMVENLVGAAYISNDNIPTPSAAYDLITNLHQFTESTRLKIPLLLGVDQEGAWSVMTDGSAMGPGNMAVGATHDAQNAYTMYELIGKELASVGLNAVFAPCADCNSNPNNSIIGMRSFGEFPDLVSKMTASAVQGAYDGGVIPTIKHFPGHGDTTLDSHRGLPSVNRSQKELWEIDLKPFQAGIDAGAQIVMTAHILFPAFDPDNPATLSSIILKDVLRDEMGFEGVILSDSMNMHSMKKNYHPHDSAIQAILAGVDLIMLAEEHYDHNKDTYLADQKALIHAVIDAVQDDTIPMNRIDEALGRVLKLKSEVAQKNRPTKENALKIVGSDAHHQIEIEIAQKAISIIRDEHHQLPMDTTKPIILINTTTRSSYAILEQTRGIGPNQTKPAFDVFATALQDKLELSQVISAERFLANQDIDIAEDAIVLAVTENYALPGIDFDQDSQKNIVEQLHQMLGERLIVVALRDPYELRDFPPISAYICSFSFRHSASIAMANVLCEGLEISGKSPVSI